MTWDEAYKRYEAWLDEAGEPCVVQIPRAFGSSVTFAPSHVLREISPGGYVDMFNDWADGEGIDTDTLTGEDRHA